MEQVAHHLEVYGPGNDSLVLHHQGRAVRRQDLTAVWASARRKAGLPEVGGFHALRHAFATTLLSGGVSVAAAAEYLGDIIAVMLATYAHVIPADTDRARAVLDAALTRQDGDAQRHTR